MVILYGAKPMWGLPDPSPFVTKAELLLKMAGIAHERKFGDFKKAPKGKFPWIDDDGTLVPDSTLIRLHIERTRGFDFDKGLSKEEAGVLWGFEKLCEDHLYFMLVSQRWVDDANFERGPRQFFQMIPAPLRPIMIPLIRRGVRKALHGQGFGRYTAAEGRLLAARAFGALNAWIETRDFFGGKEPVGADASIFATVQGALCPLFDGFFREEAEKFPALKAYVARMEARFYPKA